MDVRAAVPAVLRGFAAAGSRSWGATSFPSVDAGLIRLHMRARAGQRVEETAREADGVDNLIRRVIPPEDLGNILDNIGLFNSTINTTYSNSGVIGESDAEILIGLKPERKMPTKYYIDQLAPAIGRRVSRNAILFSAGRHGQPDSEFRRARPDRYPAHRPERARQLRAGAADLQSHSAHSRSGGRSRSAVALLPNAVSECGPHAGAVRGPEPAGRGQQPACSR